MMDDGTSRPRSAPVTRDDGNGAKVQLREWRMWVNRLGRMAYLADHPRRQARHVRPMVAHAYTTVPYYRRAVGRA
jgi:hypothetical protein